jgi:putative transcriptional regulator
MFLGMPIRWQLDKLMTDAELSGYALARATGLTASAIYKLRSHKTVKRLEGETLAKLCGALKCTPGDLLEYVPPRPKSSRS